MKPLAHWPEAERRGLRGVFTDIDDTLTTHGAISPDALQALADLKAAGLAVIPITGRPIGWCEPFMRAGRLQDRTPAPAWPVDAMVAENGAVAWAHRAPAENRYQIGLQSRWNIDTLLSKLYQTDAGVRADNLTRMRHIAAQITLEMPEVQLSADSAGRETDLAFDHNEFAHLSPATVQRVVSRLQQAGMHTTVSSIHIHGCFGDFNKWQGACWIVRELWGRDLAKELDAWVFVGDSGNDEAMFKHFTHTVGVANIARFVPQLQHLPRYVTEGERGAGFAQVAAAILQARSV